MKSEPGERDETTEADLDVIEMLAATWLSRRDRGLTPEEAVEFAVWRSADARHETAVRNLSEMWGALDDLAALQGKVVQLPVGSVVAEMTKQPRQKWNWAPWALAAAAGVAVVVTVATRREQPVAEIVAATMHYETAVGEQRAVTLADGSTLRLNTDSAVDVRYTAQGRRVELARGEVRFTVTKDAARPFVVAAEGTEARALGTVFIVRRREKETELVVTEGRVKFSAGADAPTAIEVAAGQAAVCDPRSPTAMKAETLDQAALARRLAWESGWLVCRPGMPLAEVVAEFNRYHRKKFVLRDTETGAVTVGGAFKLNEPEVLVKTLETSFDVAVVERDAAQLALKLKR